MDIFSFFLHGGFMVINHFLGHVFEKLALATDGHGIPKHRRMRSHDHEMAPRERERAKEREGERE